MRSLVGVEMLAISLGREMFYKQFRYNLMIDRNTFQGNIDVRKVEGCQYIHLYSILGEFPV